MIIRRLITPFNRWIGRRGDTVKWIVIHYTANEEKHGRDTAEGEAKYAASQYLGVSAHFYVDENEVYQSVPVNDTAWHCGDNPPPKNGCRNTSSIGIEMCNRYIDGKYYILDETVDNTVELVLELLRAFPDAQICRHYDVTGKKCPAPWVDDPTAWEKFMNRVKEGEPLTATERKEIDDLEEVVAGIDERTEVRYNSVDDCPSWLKPTVKKLVAKGYLEGYEDGTLGLTQDVARVLVINDRAGVYGE